MSVKYMQIKKQFKRQNRIYIFSIIVPVIVWLEFLTYIWWQTGEIDTFALYNVGSIVVVVVSILLLIHMQTSITFWKQVDTTLEKLHYLEQENLKIGRLLVNEKFILDYGMLRKRVIPIEGIFCAKNRKDHVVSARVAFDVNKIALLRKGAKEILLCAPVDFLDKESAAITDAINDAIEGKRIRSDVKEFYKKYPCDFPFYSLLSICIYPIVGVLIWLFPYIRDLFVDNQDKIKTLLFCVSYEGRIRVIIVILLYLFFVGMFILKHFFMGINMGSLKTFFALVLIINLTPFMQFALPWEFAQYCAEYKEDYKAYGNGEYEMMELELYDAGDVSSGSCLDKASDIVERYDIDIRKVRYPDSIYADDSLYLVNNDIEIKEECIYRVKYLKNSRIIVKIQEVE